jgi:hypothetical protein
VGYGFRLFKVFPAKGPAGYTPIPVEISGDAGTQHYQDHVAECLDLLISWSTLTGAPALKPSAQLKVKEHRQANGTKGDPRIRFLSHELTDEGHRLFKLEYGRVGRFPKALAVKKSQDAHIHGLATGHPYRCLLMLPATGTTGLMAVEDVDSNTTARIVPNWLSRASHYRQKKAPADQQARAIRLVARQVKDLPRLREMIGTAEHASLRLTKKTVSGSSKRKTTKVKLEYKLDTKADRDEATGWAEQFAGLGDGNLQGDGVAEMTEIVDGSLETVGFTDAVVVLQGDDGTKKLGANKLDDLFVYPLGEDRLEDQDWAVAVLSVVDGMQSWLEVDVFSAKEQ